MKFCRSLACSIAALVPAISHSDATLYGIVDAYVQALDGTSRLARLQSGGSAASRFGIRGQEDLGGGLAVRYTLESGLQLDDGSIFHGSAFWGRQVWVGLSGPWGQVTAGRQYSSTYFAVSEFSAFGLNPAGPSTGVIGGFAGGYEPVRGAAGNVAPAAGATGSGGPARLNNSLRYESPFWQNLQLSVAYGAGEQSGGTTDTRVLDLGLRYSNGQLQAFVSVLSDQVKLGGVKTTDVTVSTLSATYSWGPWRALGGVMVVDDGRIAAEDGRGYWIGADWRNGRHVLRAQWVQNKPRYGVDNKTNAAGVGYSYEFSRRTQLYGSLTRFDNDAMAGAGLGRFNAIVPSGLTRIADNKITEMVIGVRHSF